ncbi:MAG TPA: cytochrome c [bacterium]|nr:cytochrome c [bacterium]
MNRTFKSQAFWWLVYITVPIVVIILLNALSRDYTELHYVWPTQMENDAAYESYEVNRIFPNGMTMQMPVEGTIPRGYHTFHYDTTEASMLQAGKELKNPFKPNEQNITRGESVFNNFCLICHGETGGGDGPLIPKYPNPTSFHTEASKNRPDGEMFHVITMGRNNMSSYSSQVNWDDRWKVILYIRQLQNKKKK